MDRRNSCSADEASCQDEIALPSGRITRGVVRVGDTVRRPSKESSPFVACLLGRFEMLNVSWAPRYLGQDAQSRDILTFIPGSVPLKWRTFSDQQVRDASLLLRRFHDATRESELRAGCSVVCHNDPGPNNFVFQDEQPVAIIDFDMAAPGEPLEDLGYMAWSWCISSKADRLPTEQQARQVRLIVDAYGFSGNPTDLFAAIVERLERNILFWSERQASPETTALSSERIAEDVS